MERSAVPPWAAKQYQPERALARAILAFGGNQKGKWGHPQDNIERSLDLLKAAGATLCHKSVTYQTMPTGPGLQSSYVNLVAILDTDLSPRQLLLLAKRLERRAGRGVPRHWAPRPLDIDIVAYHGRVIGWPAGKQRGRRLVVPHPLMHERRFVLVPLVEIAPNWRHPVLGLKAVDLLRRQRRRPRGI